MQLQIKLSIMLKKLGIFLIIYCAFQPSYGQTDSISPKENPFSFEASYVGDVYYNAVGGLKQGCGYMGMANLKMGFDTEKARWWKGGSFFINGASIHGKSLTENYLGDLQVASNIDAGTYVYMHELWYRQDFKKVSFTVGLQDLNAEFLTSDNAIEFINSSFGVIPVVSGNIPVPIFPLTGLGISGRWNINDQFTWQTAVFDGCQTPFDGNNRNNLHWRFCKDDGVFVVTEFHSRFKINEKEGTYKFGAYYHSGLNEFDEETQIMNTVFKNNYGFYVIADQTVYEQENRKIGLFAQLGMAPPNKNEHAYYLGLGANYYGIFNKEGKDVLGLAAANLDLLKKNHDQETALELYYKYQINDNIAIQPDIQYIINPSGTEEQLPNALVGILRFYINF